MKKKPVAPDHALAGWLTIEEAAERIGMKPDTLSQHCYRRTCPCRRIGRAILIHQDEIDRWAATRRRPGRPSEPGKSRKRKK
jgi:excisionase family DNA binding protein